MEATEEELKEIRKSIHKILDKGPHHATKAMLILIAGFSASCGLSESQSMRGGEIFEEWFKFIESNMQVNKIIEG